MRSLTLLVPVLNETLLIDEFVAKTTADMNASGVDWELILIDDGSRDDSFEKMKRCAAAEPRIKAISLGTNHGPGANYWTGFAMASKEHVCWATVDAFYDTTILKDLMAYTDEYASISAYRTDLTGHTPMRRVQTVANVLIMRLLFPRYSFIAYHTLQIHRVDYVHAIKIEAETPFICSELLFKARAMGLKIKEVGIEYLPRKKGKATGGSPKLIARHVTEMMKFWFRWVVLRQPIIDPVTAVQPTPSQALRWKS